MSPSFFLPNGNRYLLSFYDSLEYIPGEMKSFLLFFFFMKFNCGYALTIFLHCSRQTNSTKKRMFDKRMK